MALTAVEGSPGAPWERDYQGRLERLTVESELLRDNPLGDPATRPLYVYLPPGHGEGTRRYPTIYVIQGYTGALDMWANRTPFEPTMFERVDDLFSGIGARRAIVVFVDAWTKLGGSQFLNSPGTGRYMDYLCDEVVPFVDENYWTIADRDHRGIAGKSSGGYGAMVVPMLRPDVFGALASHSGDALFEVCYQSEFPAVVRKLRDLYEGSMDVFWKKWEARDRFDFDLYGPIIEFYGYAAAYSAEPDGTVLLPFDLDTAAPIPEVWERWLAWDPVRMAPDHADALRSMRLIHIEAGNKDEAWLDLGARAFSKVLNQNGVEHRYEIFPAGHMGLQYRYPAALAALAEAMTP